MPALNKIQLIGYLGLDPETHYTAAGRTVCTFNLAVPRAAGDYGDADWFSVEAWGRLGEVCQQYLAKGRLIYLEGRLQTTPFDEPGEARYFAKVLASAMQMLDRQPEEMEVIAEGD